MATMTRYLMKGLHKQRRKCYNNKWPKIKRFFLCFKEINFQGNEKDDQRTIGASRKTGSYAVF